MPTDPLEACAPMILGMVDSLAGPTPGCFRRPCIFEVGGNYLCKKKQSVNQP